MQDTVTLNERFPTWAAASAARNRLAHHGDVSIERVRDEFELVIQTDDAHRDEIDHLLRSSGTMFNRPLGQRPRRETGATSPLLIFGIAAAAGAALYAFLKREPLHREEPLRSDAELDRDARRWDGGRDDETEWQHRQLEPDKREGLRSHAEGYGV